MLLAKLGSVSLLYCSAGLVIGHDAGIDRSICKSVEFLRNLVCVY